MNISRDVKGSLLFIKPLKTMPDRLIYKTKTTIQDCIHSKDSKVGKYPAYIYNMVDVKNGGKFVGKMIAAPILYQNPSMRFYQIPAPYKSFYIELLKTFERGNGYGKEFINFAKIESKKYGCEGRIHLIASRLYDRLRPPHVFYKKCGFISKSALMNAYLDNCIKLNRPIGFAMSDNLDMFMPLVEHTGNLLIKAFNLWKFIKK